VAFSRDVARMVSLLRRERFDIVDVHGSQDSWVTGCSRLLTGLPSCLVMTRHNTKRVRTGAANRLLYGRLIDHLIIVDESIRAQYAALLSRGALDDGMISVIPSAYRADLFHPGVSGRRVRAELGLDDQALVVGVAGRLVQDKGHIYLMRAVAALAGARSLDARPNLHLVFAGLGPLETELRAQAAALGLGKRAHFLGFRADINEVEAAFDIAVLPSVGCDASSASIKEAMALGVPVVASDIGGARSLIADGVTGLVVPPGDAVALAAALESLMTDRDRARAMAQAAQAQVGERYNIGRLADETLGAYQAALSGARRARRAEAPGYPAGRMV
jgi:glycosyltransferase involved in cell wall biosynthesis